MEDYAFMRTNTVHQDTKKFRFYCSYQNHGDHELSRIQGEEKELSAENHFDKSVHNFMINKKLPKN